MNITGKRLVPGISKSYRKKEGGEGGAGGEGK